MSPAAPPWYLEPGNGGAQEGRALGCHLSGGVPEFSGAQVTWVISKGQSRRTEAPLKPSNPTSPVAAGMFCPHPAKALQSLWLSCHKQQLLSNTDAAKVLQQPRRVLILMFQIQTVSREPEFAIWAMLSCGSAKLRLAHHALRLLGLFLWPLWKGLQRDKKKRAGEKTFWTLYTQGGEGRIDSEGMDVAKRLF